MFGFGIRYFCVLILIQTVLGRIIDLEYGYQEIDELIPQNELENTDAGTIEELCRKLKGRIYIKEIDGYVDCLESLFADSREVKLVKRDTDKNVELEGSGDSDDQKVPSTENEPETTLAQTTIVPIEPSSEPPSILKETDVQNPTPNNSSEIKDTTSQILFKESDVSSTEAPLLFKNGFDEILQMNVNLTKGQKASVSMGSGLKNETLKLNDGKPPLVAAEEVIKTGASKEESSQMSPNNILLIILGALGVVGILALVFNYVKNNRDDKEIDEVMRLEAEGRELKEMKPLMKDPLNQNGSKSLEYIDADPQYGNGVEIKAEVNRNQEVEH